MLDGHDEYKVGVNKEIDDAIKRDSLGHCCIILTSRTSRQLIDVRKYMDIEVEILGFDKETAENYAGKYLGSTSKAKTLIDKIHDMDADQPPRHRSIDEFYSLAGLTRLPILLQMLCVLDQGKYSLPDTKAGIIYSLIERSIRRSALRSTETMLSQEIKIVLQRLGKAAWESLRKDTQQLFITKVCT